MPGSNRQKIHQGDERRVDLSETFNWVIVVADRMTYDEAAACGKHLGSKGYTGRFLNGSLADQVALIPKLKDRIAELTGERDDRSKD